VKIAVVIVVGVVLVTLIGAFASTLNTRAYIEGGFCQQTVRRDLPDIQGYGRPNWTWDTQWVKCAVATPERTSEGKP
jgi:hypothetical protein